MNSIPQSIQSMGAHAKKTFYFFQRYRVGQILRTANACKIKGFQAVLVFLVLVESVFESRSLYMQRKLHPETLPFAKDVTYRFLNSCHTNWRRFVLLLAGRIIRDTIEPLTDRQRRNAIVIDESGITDNTDSMGSGFTPWEQISEVFLLRLKDDTYLCAVPTDYDSWASTRNRRQARLAQANKDMGFAPIRIQFKKASDKYTAQDGLAAVRRFAPEKISRIRKPKY